MNSLPVSIDPTSDSADHLYDLNVTEIEAAAVEIAPCGCVACDDNRMRPVFRLEETPWRVVTCVGCGIGRLHPLPTPCEIATFYPPAYYGDAGRKFTLLIEWAVRFVASRRVRFLVQRVPRGGRVLDVGCGRGTLLAALAERGLEAHGVEISSVALKGADPRAQVRIASTLSEAGYPDRHFDLVILWHVLEHLPNPREVLTEIHRILRPGGEVVIAVPNFSSWQARWAGPAWFHLDPPRHLYHYTREALRGLVAACGFDSQSEHHFSLRQNPFGWVQSWLNQCRRGPRNQLYEFLQHRSECRDSPAAIGRKMTCLAELAAGLPIGLALELLATAFRAGATLHIVARAVK